MNSHAAPPTPVLSHQLGRSPMYSEISIGASSPMPHDATPSTSSFVSPASARARADACWCSSNGVLVSTRPQSDNAAPTMATRFVPGSSAPDVETAGAAVEDLRVHDVADLGGIPLARTLRCRDVGAQRPRDVVGDGVADRTED